MKKYFVGPADGHTYPTEYYGVAVIEDQRGEWVADLCPTAVLCILNCEQLEQKVAEILNLDPLTVFATPIGPDVSGDPSVRNLYVNSDNWLITVK